jgi:hypothetical protein
VSLRDAWEASVEVQTDGGQLAAKLFFERATQPERAAS